MASSSDDMSGVAHQGMIVCDQCRSFFLYQMDSPPNFRLLKDKTVKQVSISRTFKIDICSRCMGSMGINHTNMKMENLKAMFVNQYMRYLNKNMNSVNQPPTSSFASTVANQANQEETRKLLLRNAPLPEFQGRKVLITNNNVFVRGGNESRPSAPAYSPFVDDSEEENEDEEEEDEDGNEFEEDMDFVDDSEEEPDIQ